MTVPTARLGPAIPSHEVHLRTEDHKRQPLAADSSGEGGPGVPYGGEANAQIAASLNISPSTLKTHVSSIYAKLDVSNRTQAGVVGSRIFAFTAALTG